MSKSARTYRKGIEYLEARMTLYRLCFASRQFHRAATQPLYHTINFRVRGHEAIDDLLRFVQLLRSLVESPHLRLFDTTIVVSAAAKGA